MAAGSPTSGVTPVIPTYSQIWLMSRDGRGATMLTEGPFSNCNPTWSADSRKIALASDRDGDWEIYVLRPGRAHDRPS